MINPNQRENSIVRCIKQVPWCFADSQPLIDGLLGYDFRMTSAAGALFLSLKYHMLYREYIVGRMKDCDRSSATKVKVLLVFADVDDTTPGGSTEIELKQVTMIAMGYGFTVLVAWTKEEAARYLETFTAFEKKGADSIKEHTSAETDFHARATEILTSIKSVNSTDAANLLKRFGTFAALVNASMDELGMCPGIGPSKVKRLYDSFHKPFSLAKPPAISPPPAKQAKLDQ